jgi:rhomboid protease GluP
VLFIPLFLHASLDHLFSNMISLTGGGAVIEEYYGRKRMLLIYIVSGLFGAMFSLLKDRSVLAVGASGAIMGLFGASLVFLARNRRRFRMRERWRATRIQLPFLLLMVIPSIFYADLLSHLGGFLAGAMLAARIAPLPDRLPPERA